MTIPYVHYLPGGGLGDVFREGYYHNSVGVLKRFKLEHPRAHLKLVLMSHNPAVADLFEGQTWLDELKVVPFASDDIGNWPSCYREYPGEFANHIELRFNTPDHRSNYRADLAIHRPRSRDVKLLPGVSTAWELSLTREEWELVELHANKIVFHPYAGDFQRTISEDIQDWLTDSYGKDWLRIGVQYNRVNHADETGVELKPRVLVEVLRRARGVIGTESSVYYIASMLGTRTLMLYRDGHAYANWAHKNDATWDWFFNTEDPYSKFVRMPLSEDDRTTIETWLK